jgi:hypothetical protein
MTPVTQTRVGEKVGNCFAACLASILNLEMADIPEFSTDEDLWLNDIQEFLATHGLYYVQLPPEEPTLLAAFEHGTLFHTIEGTSPRGGQHACVGENGELVWDPHPDDGTGHGLVHVECFGLLCARCAK